MAPRRALPGTALAFLAFGLAAAPAARAVEPAVEPAIEPVATAAADDVGGRVLPSCDLSKSGADICDDFCNYRCSFFNESAGDKAGKHRVTLYRLTPGNITGIRNKNTGDPRGDISFALGKKNATAECAKDPKSIDCLDLSNMLYGMFEVEVDGQWGPYAECNPIQHGGQDPIFEPQWKDSQNFLCGVECLFPTETGCHMWDYPKPFENKSESEFGPQCRCDSTHREIRAVARASPKFLSKPDDSGVPSSWGPQCQEGYSAAWRGRCLHGKVYKTVTGWSVDAGLSLACDTCREDPDCTGWSTEDNRTFSLFTGRVRRVRRRPWAPRRRCLAARAYQGAWSKGGKSWFGVGRLGGLWFATPTGGECLPGQRLGHAGCTWREVSSVYKNASCINGHLDAAVEAFAPKCFRRCPQPLNRTSDCYLDCYRDLLMGNAATNTSKIPQDLLVKSWVRAFKQSHPAKGGCPAVQPIPCAGDQCDPLSPPFDDAAATGWAPRDAGSREIVV